WSEAKGNPQMKLQGSDTQSIKTLQSENAPQPKSRFPISGLAFLHGRPIIFITHTSRQTGFLH
ncbi:MAG TPA: hypothetical protein VMT72_05020, partial [Pseudolabrys sp.]|nr:hypothetical protein [Pseudolabrys sp.]